MGGEGSRVKKAKGWPKGEGSKGKRRHRDAGCEPRDLPREVREAEATTQVYGLGDLEAVCGIPR